MRNKVYLDNQAVTFPSASLIDKIAMVQKEHWLPQNSPHLRGQDSLRKNCYSALYKAIGAQTEDQFVVTSGSRDAAECVFLSTYLDFVRETGRNHFITSNVEGNAIHTTIENLEDLGCVGKVVAVNHQGLLTREALEGVLNPRTSLVAISWANELTGVIHPVFDLAEACRKKEVKFYVDASAVIGKLFFRFQDMPIDFLSFEGKKLHAPAGVGGLFVKKGKALSPLTMHENRDQLSSLVALSTALETLSLYFDHLCTETARLRDRLEKGILEHIPESQVFFKSVERLPHCSAIAFPGVSGEALLYALEQEGICASIGGNDTPFLSQLLQACGIEGTLAHSAVSFSLSYETTEEEIDRALEVIITSVQKLRSYSGAIL